MNLPPKPNKDETAFQSEAVRTYRTFFSDPPTWTAGHGVEIPVALMTPVHVRKVLEQVRARAEGLATRVVWGSIYLNGEEASADLIRCSMSCGARFFLEDRTPLMAALTARKAKDEQ